MSDEPRAVVEIGLGARLRFDSFLSVVEGHAVVRLTAVARQRLIRTRAFIDHLVESNVTVYGLTTGFADLRNICVNPAQAAELSHNLVTSHDAGIGSNMPCDVVAGAMLLRAHALALGHSGIMIENLDVLVKMLNSRIFPHVPETGSLGASGDLAYLARLGRAMEGTQVLCDTPNGVVTAAVALDAAGISPARFGAKDGLALTNGTSFMASMCVLGYVRQVRLIEDLLTMDGLFLNAFEAVDAAFFESVHRVRGLQGQSEMAKLLHSHLVGSPFTNQKDVQNDYCIRCLPQIMGPMYEFVHTSYVTLVAEMNAVTDNPLLFCGDEISRDVTDRFIHEYDGDRWAVLSGGNFHGEPLAQLADNFARLNAKWMYTMERQQTVMLNPARHKGVEMPCYLCTDADKLGLLSGFMIVQYTANALCQKIAFLGNPTSVYNITSGNESEDVVSFGATASQKWLHQLGLMQQFAVTFLTTASQAYAIARAHREGLTDDLHCERIFRVVQAATDNLFPTREDVAFGSIYARLKQLLHRGDLRAQWIRNPLKLPEEFLIST